MLSNIYKSFVSLLQFWQSSGSKLIYSGSSTKFSNNGEGRHLFPYTAAKSLNTELLFVFAKWYELPFSIVYFYNVYGGCELRDGKYSTVIGKFKELASKGATKLPITPLGTQCRNFTHIDDITDGILLAAEYGAGDGYGIGADESYSIIDVCNVFGCEPEFQRASPANRMNSDVHTDKIKELGWTQKHSLKAHITTFWTKLRKSEAMALLNEGQSVYELLGAVQKIANPAKVPIVGVRHNLAFIWVKIILAMKIFRRRTRRLS